MNNLETTFQLYSIGCSTSLILNVLFYLDMRKSTGYIPNISLLSWTLFVGIRIWTISFPSSSYLFILKASMIFYYFTYFSLLHTIFSNRIQKKHIGWVTTMFVSFITCTAFIGMIMLIGLVLYLNNSTGWNNVNKLLRVCHTISVVVITIGIIIIDLLFIKQIYINQQGIVTETKARVIYKSLLLEILFGLLVLLLTIKTTEMEFISQTYSFDWTFISWCLVNSMEIKNPVQQIKTKTLKLDVIESTKKAENSILTKADVQTTNGQLAGKSILSNSMKKSTRFDITKTPEIELE